MVILGTPNAPIAAQDMRVDVPALRALFLESVTDEVAIDSAQVLLAALPVPRAPIYDAYAAMFEVMRARHAFWPVKKMNHLNAGLRVLDGLVAQHPEQAEIRYLRLMSCYYLPRFLGRGWSIQEDFRVLARLLPEAADQFPADMYRLMVAFIEEKADLPEAERTGLRRALAKLDEGMVPSPPAGMMEPGYEKKR
jgi:hypothetical protein